MWCPIIFVTVALAVIVVILVSIIIPIVVVVIAVSTTREIARRIVHVVMLITLTRTTIIIGNKVALANGIETLELLKRFSKETKCP